MEYIERLWPEWTCAGEIGRDAAGPIYKIRKTSGGGRMAQCALQVISVPGGAVSSGTLRGAGLDKAAVRDFYAKEAQSILREAELWRSLQSEPTIHHILEIKKLDLAQVREESGEVPGYRIYLRMELLRGADHYMDELARRSGTGSPDAWPVVCLGLDILSALSRLKKHGIIHGGVRPSALCIDDMGIFRLGGYDITRGVNPGGYCLTEAGLYMAPELSETGESDASADTYALALVLYRYLNHRRIAFSPAPGRPLSAADVIEAQVKRMRGEPLPLPDGCDKDLGAILVRAASASPGDRFRSPEEFRDALLVWAWNHSYLDLSPRTKEEIDPADIGKPRVHRYDRYGGRYRENGDQVQDYARILEDIDADMGFFQAEEAGEAAGTDPEPASREEAAIYRVGEEGAERVPDQLYPERPARQTEPEKRIVVQVGDVRVSAPRPAAGPAPGKRKAADPEQDLYPESYEDTYNRKRKPRPENEEGLYVPPREAKRVASDDQTARRLNSSGETKEKKGGFRMILLIFLLILVLAALVLFFAAPVLFNQILESLAGVWESLLSALPFG